MQVYKRKQSSARNLLEQPMLASVYEEPPAWTLPRLIRSAVITLLSGFIAGVLYLSSTVSELNLCAFLACCPKQNRSSSSKVGTVLGFIVS